MTQLDVQFGACAFYLTLEGSLLLHLDPASLQLPAAFVMEGRRWIRKPELHVTLVSAKRALIDSVARAQNISADEAQRQLRALVDAAPSVVVHAQPSLLHVKKEYDGKNGQLMRETLIVLCELDDVDGLWSALEEVAVQTIERPPFHVTLYTLDSEASREGIGIPTRAELERLAYPLAVDGLPEDVAAAMRHVIMSRSQRSGDCAA